MTQPPRGAAGMTEGEIRAATVGEPVLLAGPVTLADPGWTYVQNYADAKSAVIEEIIGRARAGGR